MVDGFILEIMGLVSKNKASYQDLLQKLVSKKSWLSYKSFETEEAYNNLLKVKFREIDEALGIEKDPNNLKYFANFDLKTLKEFVNRIKTITIKKLQLLKGTVALIRSVPEFPYSPVDASRLQHFQSMVERKLKNDLDLARVWEEQQICILQDGSEQLVPTGYDNNKYRIFLIKIMCLLLLSEGSFLKSLFGKLFGDVSIPKDVKDHVLDIIKKYLNHNHPDSGEE
jgi:hypothetical protein